MNAITKQPENQAAATPGNRELLNKAEDFASHLRDAIYAVRMIVTRDWGSGHTADTARNALDWISKKMDEECDALHDVLEELDPYEARS
jgi:hypothetical protein